MTFTLVVRDISHHNEISNYDALRAANDAFQIKITEGTTFVDDHAWRTDLNRPGAHYLGCAGRPRAPYHFARPVSIPDQVGHFLRTKHRIGSWERLDMLDCEFSGITGAFIRALVAEYRRQSGIYELQVYLGKYEVTTTCPPSTWWDPGIAMQVARYRKIGPPRSGDVWADHLGFDHPGLTTYQWDNAWPLYSGGPAGDISYDRKSLTQTTSQEPDMDLTNTGIPYPYQEQGDAGMTVAKALGFASYIPADMAKDDDGMAGSTMVDGSNRLSIPALRDDVDKLHDKIDALTDLIRSMKQG